MTRNSEVLVTGHSWPLVWSNPVRKDFSSPDLGAGPGRCAARKECLEHLVLCGYILRDFLSEHSLRRYSYQVSSHPGRVHSDAGASDRPMELTVPESAPSQVSRLSLLSPEECADHRRNIHAHHALNPTHEKKTRLSYDYECMDLQFRSRQLETQPSMSSTYPRAGLSVLPSLRQC